MIWLLFVAFCCGVFRARAVEFVWLPRCVVAAGNFLFSFAASSSGAFLGERFVARVIGRGKVTIPVWIRELMDVRDGDYIRLEFVEVVMKGGGGGEP